MTAEEWLALQVGDQLIDRRHGNALRTVLAIKRSKIRAGSRGAGRTRTVIAVNNLKSKGARTHVWDTDDLDGGLRFAKVPAGIL